MGRFGGAEYKRLQRLRNKAYLDQKGYCFHCSEPMPSPFKQKQHNLDPMRCTAEHIVKVADGGKTTKENVVAAHQECNSKRDPNYKGVRTLWRRKS